MLQDDPAFLPDLAFPDLDTDLSALDLSTNGTSHGTSNLSQRSLQSSQSSHPGQESGLPGLVIPTSDTGADIGGFVIPGDDDSSPLPGSRMGGAQLGGDEDGLLPDVDFEFDADGNLIELNAEERARRQSAANVGGSRISRDSATTGRVRQEHEEGLQAMARLGVSAVFCTDIQKCANTF